MYNDRRMDDNSHQSVISNYLTRIAAAAVITFGPSIAMANNAPKAPEPNKKGIEAILNGFGKLAGGAVKLVYDCGAAVVGAAGGIVDGTGKFIGKYFDDSINNYKSLDYYLFDKGGSDPVYGITHQPGNFVGNFLNLGYTVLIGWPSEAMNRAKEEKEKEGKKEEKGPVIFVVDSARFLKHAGGVAGEAAYNLPGATWDSLSKDPLNTLLNGFESYMVGDLIFRGTLTGGNGHHHHGIGETPAPDQPFPPVPK